MLSTRLYPKYTILSIAKRFQSTEINTQSVVTPRIHPLLRLKNILDKKFDENASSSQILETFKDEMTRIKLSDYKLAKSNYCNNEFLKLLELTQSELKNNDINMIPPTPYEILTTLIGYKLVRHQHFESVMKSLLSESLAKDTIGVWVNYLECSNFLQETSKSIVSSQFISSYAVLAYLLLDSKPDIEKLSQLLNIPSGRYDKIPFDKISKLVNQSNLFNNNVEKIQYTLKDLIKQSILNDKNNFIKQVLPNISDYNHVRYLYNQFSEVNNVDGNVTAAFMEKFASLEKSMVSMKCFNAYKQSVDIIDLSVKNALLTVVSCMKAFPPVKETKLQRIEAIWNSYIKTSEKIDISSYIKLIDALIKSNNIEHLQKIWDLDIPKVYKKDSQVLQLYLSGISKTDRISLEKLLSLVPSKIENLHLANNILLKMIKSNQPSSQIDTFYEKNFLSKDALKPDSATLAIKMYGNYLNKKSNEFKFLPSIGVSASLELPIIEKFLEICPSIEIIRELYDEVKSTANSHKFGKFIKVEFIKGDWKHAESIFKDYLKLVTKDTYVNKNILEPLFYGFSQLMIKENDSSYLNKLKTYWTISQRIYHEVTFDSMVNLLNAIGILGARNVKFDKNELNFINDTVLPELVKTKIEKDFKLNEKILNNLKKSDSIIIPKDL